MSEVSLEVGDCLDVFGRQEPRSLDALIQDWPAGIGFMGRSWDKDRGGRAAWVAYWQERAAAGLRLAKPGAYSLTWALPRTAHWAGWALEEAGWFVRDVIHHCFGQGWNKDHGLLKPAHEHWILAQAPLDKGLTLRANIARWGTGRLFTDACRVPRGEGIPVFAEGSGPRGIYGELEVPRRQKATGEVRFDGGHPPNQLYSHCPECEATGTRAVRGSHDAGLPVVNKGVGYGGSTKGADGSGFASTDGTETVPAFDCLAGCLGCGAHHLAPSGGAAPRCKACGQPMVWACPVAELDAKSKAAGMHSAGSKAARGSLNNTAPIGYGGSMIAVSFRHGDTDQGSAASRFFPTFHYAAKSSTAERDLGCEDFYWRANKRHPFGFERVTREAWEALPERQRAQGNVHPTVKNGDLCRWLCRLVTPKGGRLGDGVVGSGSIAIAGWQEGISVLACDLSPEAIEIARARLAFWQTKSPGATVKTLKRAPSPRSGQPTLFDGLDAAGARHA